MLLVAAGCQFGNGGGGGGGSSFGGGSAPPGNSAAATGRPDLHAWRAPSGDDDGGEPPDAAANHAR